MNFSSSSFFFQHREFDGEGCSLSELALDLDFSLVEVNDFLDVGEAQSESLHIVYVSGVNAVELVKHLLEALFLNADARIADGEVEVLVVVPGLQVYIYRLVGLAILHGVVDEVVDDILEMYIVDVDG